MNKPLSLLIAIIFAVTTFNLEAATPKAAESESDQVTLAPDAPKPKKTKLAPSTAQTTKPVKPPRESKPTKKSKVPKKSTRSKKNAVSS
jgi:hypothetical protein